MWDPQKVFSAIIFCGIYGLASCDFITVVGSKTLRIDEAYKVAVTSHSLTGSNKTIYVGIEGTSFEGDEYEVYDEVQISPGETKVVKLYIPNLNPGVFSLLAAGDDFEESVSLYFNPQRVSLLIQLNKPVFKTDDLVEFRVFAIDSRTKPYKIKSESKIWILDPGNNHLHSLENPSFVNGIYEDGLVLNDAEPGIWKLLVEADGQFSSKSFEVRKDTKPVFELILTTPSKNVAYRDGSIKIKVKVKAIIKSSIIGSSGFAGTLKVNCNDRGVTIFSSTQQIVDETLLDINFKNDLRIDEISEARRFDLHVEFDDDYVTNQTYSASTSFVIEINDYIISIVHSPHYFKPEIPYTFTLLVTRINGYPVLNSQLPIEVIVKDDDNFLLNSGKYSLDPNTGSVEIDTTGISLTAVYLKIEATYDKVTYAEKIFKSRTTLKNFLSMNVLTPRPKMYEPVEFQIVSTLQVPSVVFQLFSKGLLKISRIVKLEGGTRNFTVIPKFAYTPKAHCIVFFINNEGQIVTDSITLHFDNQLPNFVNLTLSSQDVKPGTEFNLTVSSTLNSSVSLLAIDQRILTMGSGHDITKDYIFDNDLVKYDEVPIDLLYDPSVPFWFYQNSYQRKFIDVGAVIITNAVQEIPCESHEVTKSSELTADEEVLTEENFLTTNSVTSLPIIPNENVKKRFLETFLFKTIEITTPDESFGGITGSEVLQEQIPDIMTSWIITGISLSNKFGLGITTSPATVNAYLLFYIDFSLPHSVKIGEILQLEFLVVNLLDHDALTEVNFINEFSQFNVLRSGAYNWKSSDDEAYQQHVMIPAQSLHRFRIEIQPVILGLMDLKVSATTSHAGDVVERTLLIQPEGFLTYENHAELVFVEDCDENGVELTLECLVPPEALNETVQVEASVSGDVIGPALLHLESLIRMPFGSGEQIMLTFVPNILALDYLATSDQLTPLLNETIVDFLEIAYEKMMKYRHSDGSFSAFGKANQNGSTWLTAYVAKSFRSATKYIHIDEDVIEKALNYITSKQDKDGKFREDGFVLHKSLQSGTGRGIAFTAYISSVIQDDIENYPQYSANVENAMKYIKNNYDPNNIYSLAISTYSLYNAKDKNREKIFNELFSKASRSSNYIFWKSQGSSSKISSLDIETTAYVLLVLDQIPRYYQDGFKVLQWLISQQNSNGGFQSTQDTVVALQAILKFGSKFSFRDSELTIDLHYEHGPIISTTIDRRRSLLTQKHQLHESVRKLNVTATGQGFAIVQLSCNYYINNTNEPKGFNISVEFSDVSCENKITLNISANLISEAVRDTSNLAVITVEFPSGFIFDTNSPIPKEIQRLQEVNGGSAVNIYLENVSTKVTSFNLSILKIIEVYKRLPSNIEIYDYYDTCRRASATYKLPNNLQPCNSKHEPSMPYVKEYTTIETFGTLNEKQRKQTTEADNSENFELASENEYKYQERNFVFDEDAEENEKDFTNSSFFTDNEDSTWDNSDDTLHQESSHDSSNVSSEPSHENANSSHESSKLDQNEGSLEIEAKKLHESEESSRDSSNVSSEPSHENANSSHESSKSDQNEDSLETESKKLHESEESSHDSSNVSSKPSHENASSSHESSKSDQNEDSLETEAKKLHESEESSHDSSNVSSEPSHENASSSHESSKSDQNEDSLEIEAKKLHESEESSHDSPNVSSKPSHENAKSFHESSKLDQNEDSLEIEAKKLHESEESSHDSPNVSSKPSHENANSSHESFKSDQNEDSLEIEAKKLHESEDSSHDSSNVSSEPSHENANSSHEYSEVGKKQSISIISLPSDSGVTGIVDSQDLAGTASKKKRRKPKPRPSSFIHPKLSSK